MKDDGDDHIGSQKYICSFYSTIVAIIAGKGPQSTAGLLSITYYILGRNEWGGKIEKVHFSHWLTLFSMYFSILRTIYFLAFLD